MSDLSRKVERKELLLNNWRGTFPGKTPIEVKQAFDERTDLIRDCLPMIRLYGDRTVIERTLKLLAQ